MSLRQRIKETSVAERENLNTRPGKAPLLKPLITGRAALEDVDNNKLLNKGTNQNNTFKKPVVAPSVGVVQLSKQPTLRLHKETAKPTTKVTVKKTELTDKKSEFLISKLHTTSGAVAGTVPSTLKRQESIVSKHVARTANDDKIEIAPSFSSKQLIGVVDADVNDKGDPQLVTEYVQDIFCHLRSLEEQYKIHEHYLATHRSTPRMRTVLVNWLADVHINFKFLTETFHMSVGILDRYLQISNNIGRETLQLVGVAAMLISGKYEELYIPDLEDFVYISDNTFSLSQLLKMEVDILLKLKWNLGRPLSIHFLRRYNKIAHIRPEQHNLGKYLIEICLLDYELCHINPSLQAAAACCFAKSILNEVADPSRVWTKTLAHYSTYSYSDIKPVILKMACHLEKSTKSRFQAINKKYAASEIGKISLNYKLKGPLVRRLIDEAQSLRKA